MLARPFLATELTRLGVLNYAAPGEKLAGFVAEIVSRLLKRSAYALAWTKRATNRVVVEQVTQAIDSGLAYEMARFYQWERAGWKDTKSLNGEPSD